MITLYYYILYSGLFSLFILYISIYNNNNKHLLLYFNYNNMILRDKYMNNLIISFALHYNFSQIKRFILSLKRTEYKGNIILFTFTISNRYKQLLLLYNISVIELYNSYPYYPHNHSIYPIAKKCIMKYLYIFKGKSFVTYRYFIYNLFIRYYGWYFNFILLTDIRDVIFQLNPFEWNIKRGVYLVEEHPNRKIGNDKSNYLYVKQYKPREELYNSTIINGGVMYGSYPELLFFLTDLLKHICLFNCNANDQGGINSFIRSTHLFTYPLYIFNSSHTPVKTLALWLFDSSKCCIPYNNIIQNKDSSIPHIIHQYDRAIKANYNNKDILNLYYSYIHFYS